MSQQSSKSFNVEFNGVIEAIQPLSITQPDSKTGVPTMPFVVQGEVVQQIYIPSSSIRGALRSASVVGVINTLAPDPESPLPFDEKDYFWLRIGGVKGDEKDKKGQDTMIAGEIIRSNPIIAVYGAGEIFTTGKLAIEFARQRLDIAASKLSFTHNSVRQDDFMRYPELFARLDPASAAAYQEYTGVKKEVSALRKSILGAEREEFALRRRKATLNEDEKRHWEAKKAEIADLKKGLAAQKKNESFKNTINMPHSAELIAPGVLFDHSLRLVKASAIQLGCLLDALRKFSVESSLGGHVNGGCGQVEMRYQVSTYDDNDFGDDGKPKRTDLGSVLIRRGEFSISDGEGFLKQALRGWDAAKKSAYADFNFSVPQRA